MVLFASKEANMVRYPYEYMGKKISNERRFSHKFALIRAIIPPKSLIPNFCVIKSDMDVEINRTAPSAPKKKINKKKNLVNKIYEDNRFFKKFAWIRAVITPKNLGD